MRSPLLTSAVVLSAGLLLSACSPFGNSNPETSSDMNANTSEYSDVAPEGSAPVVMLPEGTVTYTIDTEMSSVEWHAEKVVGAKHDGDVQIKSGEITLADGVLDSAMVTIDMTTIDNFDLEGGQKEQLVNHLKSDDFFNVAAYPEAMLTITDVQELDVTAENPNNAQVTGELTIRGITKPITFPARISVMEDKIVADAEFSVERGQFDVNFGLADGIVRENMDFVIHLEAMR